MPKTRGKRNREILLDEYRVSIQEDEEIPEVEIGRASCRERV